MKNQIRLPALVFAVGSTFYWAAVQGAWMILTDAYGLHFASELPTAVNWLVTAAPTVAYALVCVLFCHWFARRLLRSVMPKKVA